MARAIHRNATIAALLLAVTLTPTTTNPETRAARVELNFVSSPVGNLFYQLECLAGRARCSFEAYESHWLSAGFDSADQIVLDRFAKMLERYEARIQFEDVSADEEASSFGPEVTDVGPLASQGIDVQSRLQIAAYGATSFANLADRLRLLMHPADADAIVGAMEHFRLRFEEWWRGDAQAFLDSFAVELELLVEDFPELLESIAMFYGLEPTAAPFPVYVHLMLHTSKADQTRGTAIENHVLLEVRDGEQPRERVGVLVHELSHYFFSIAPMNFHRERLAGVERAASARASAAFGLMNEGLATAIGNGFLEERLQGPEFQNYVERAGSFYGVDDIDRAAKAILPVVREYLQDRRTLDEDFVQRYFSLVTDALGAKLDSAEARLQVSAYVASDGELYAAMQEANEHLHTRSVWSANLEKQSLAETVLMRHTYLNGVVLSRAADLELFADLLPTTIRFEMSARKEALSCVTSRASGAVLYLVVSDDQELSGAAVASLLSDAPSCADH